MSLKQLWNTSKTFGKCCSVLFLFRFTCMHIWNKTKTKRFYFSSVSVLCTALNTCNEVNQKSGNRPTELFTSKWITQAKVTWKHKWAENTETLNHAETVQCQYSFVNELFCDKPVNCHFSIMETSHISSVVILWLLTVCWMPRLVRKRRGRPGPKTKIWSIVWCEQSSENKLLYSMRTLSNCLAIL